MRWVFACLGLSACTWTLEDYDHIYSRGNDERVLCGASIDDKWDNAGEIEAALDKAARDGTTLHLYAHRPGDTVKLDTLEATLAHAAERELRFQTYADLEPGGGLALSFDDHDLAGWTSLRPMFERHGAKVTFFVSLYHELTADEKAQLRQLAEDGHDIEYHSTNHLPAMQVVGARGTEGYLADEIFPDLALMRADGYDPKVFAYPFGDREVESDAALLWHFANLRAIVSTCPH